MESVEQTIRMNNLSRDLKKYGFAESSQEAIAQAGAIYGVKNQEESSETVQLTRAQVNEILTRMQRLWISKENTDQKISAIADQLVKVTDKLNELIKSISLIEMNQAVFDKKLNVLKENMGEARQENKKPESYSRHQEHAEESSKREREARLEKPIDRNGVAPADVSIEKMFYCGNKR